MFFYVCLRIYVYAIPGVYLLQPVTDAQTVAFIAVQQFLICIGIQPSLVINTFVASMSTAYYYKLEIQIFNKIHKCKLKFITSSSLFYRIRTGMHIYLCVHLPLDNKRTSIEHKLSNFATRPVKPVGLSVYAEICNPIVFTREANRIGCWQNNSKCILLCVWGGKGIAT